jgi:hypothetical protein
MAIAEELARLARHPGAWVGAPPASESALQELAEAVTFKLPEAYVELLRASNGGDGFLPVQPYCLCLWPAEEVRRSHDGYEVSRDAPGLFAFATSGGGEPWHRTLTRSSDSWAASPPPNKALQLTSHSVLRSRRGTVWRRTLALRSGRTGALARS